MLGVGLGMHQQSPTAEGEATHAEFGGRVLLTGEFDPGLDFAQGHAGEMEIGVVDVVEPGEHGAMGARLRRRRASPRGGTSRCMRASGTSNSCLRLGLAASCRRRHCSIGTSTAIS